MGPVLGDTASPRPRILDYDEVNATDVGGTCSGEETSNADSLASRN